MSRIAVLISGLAILAAITLTSLYVYFWPIGYNSDYAMVGLIAKRLIEFGEIPIFVWKVGYQGVLLEASAVALMFKTFGMGPMTLNFAPAIFYLVFLFCFYRVLRVSLGATASALAILIFVTFSPKTYYFLVRTQPNYVETYLFGMFLMLLYARLVKRIYVEQSSTLSQEKLSIAAMGFVAGFAWYTYAQIVYFFVAIGLHLSLLYLKELYGRANTSLGWEIFLPSLDPSYVSGRAVLVAIRVLAIAVFTVSFLLLAFQVRKLEWGPIRMTSSPITNLPFLFGSWLAFHATALFSRYSSRLNALVPPALVFAVFAVIGNSPRLYYDYIVKGPSICRTGVSGGLDDLLWRVTVLFEGNKIFLNVENATLESWILRIFILGALGAFVVAMAGKAWDFVKGTTGRGALLEISPLCFLLLSVPPIFLASNTVSDIASSRYSFVLTLFYSMAVATTISRLKFRARWVGIPLVIFFIANNLNSIYRELSDAPVNHQASDAVIKYLDQKNLKFAYGDYWHAYTINFLTNERIIVEPTIGNYNPYYEPMISKEGRVGLILPKEKPLADSQGLTELYGNKYRVLERAPVDNVFVYILEKSS